MSRYCAMWALVLIAAVAAAESYNLRGYGQFDHATSRQPGVTTHRLRFADAERAQRFVSKLYDDCALTVGNTVEVWPTAAGDVDAIALGDTGFLVPLVTAGSPEVVVLAAADRVAVPALSAPPLRRADLTHPRFMDKWDRHCLGIWGRIGDPEKVYPDLAGIPFAAQAAYARSLARFDVNAQLNIGKQAVDLARCDNQTTWLRRYLAASGTGYQRVEWLWHHQDLYNRNPFLTYTRNPHVATRWDYYGERTLADSPLRAVQNANALVTLQPTLGDANQMAILDPNGEIGPHLRDLDGLYGPVAQREFVRFLREVRGLDLAQVGERYRGDADAFPTWEDVPLADWRKFYGWTADSQDLAGEWRFMRDDNLVGFGQGWAAADFDDTDWIRLYYPGEALLEALPADNKPIWMRRTFTVADTANHYLSLAPLTQSTVQIFVNGQPREPLNPHFHTARTYGQIDLGDRVGGPVTVALRLTEAPRGPIFVTRKAIEPFPTADPRVNARRWDQTEFVDWAVARSVAATLATIRTVEPDRPIKVHAYGGSPWGWATVARYGGFSHHTGSGPGWIYDEVKRYGASRGLQHSSEPGGPMGTLRDFRGLWGALAAMGMSAHDYFISPQSITDDPAKRAWLEEHLPEVKVMGRVNVMISPVAVVRGKLNTRYIGEFARWEDWRYGTNPVRGGELVPLLDEVRIREGNLDGFRAIVDEGTPCWDAAMTAALRAYVEAGGILVLDSLSGIHSFVERGAGPGPALAGVRLVAAPQRGAITVADADDRLPGFTGEHKVYDRVGLDGSGLEPAAGTDVVGRWPDGTPAFTRRVLGRGAVYFCGAPTYPRDLPETLAAAYGPDTWVTVDGGVDLVRTARGNNGAEELLMLRGLGKPATVAWHLTEPPAGGIYDAVTGDPVPAEIEGNVATFSVDIADWEFRWFAARRPGPDTVLNHWLGRQAQIWSGVVPPGKKPTATPFRNLDLNHGWLFATTDSVEHAKVLQDLDDDDAGLAPAELVFWNTPGTRPVPDAAIGFYRRHFDLPPAWRTGNRFALAVSGNIHDSRLHGFAGPGSIFLNGKEIWSGTRLDNAWLEVTDLLQPTGNRLEIIHPSPGICPVIRLVRTVVPESTIDLAGEWQGVAGLHDQAPVTLPGRVAVGFAYRDVAIPADLADREIWLRVEGRVTGAVINGRYRYRDLNIPRDVGANPTYEIDITPDVRFGQANRIAIGDGWRRGELTVGRVELAICRPGQWSADGTANRAALTVAELATVARDAAIVQQYPVVHAAVAKPAPTLAATAPELPPAVVDLDFSAADGAIRDRGAYGVEVTTRGRVEPCAEAGGKIPAVYLRGESDDPGTIELAPAVFRKHVEGKSATIRAWVRPLAVDAPGGSLLNWCGWIFGWRILNDGTAIEMPSAPRCQLTVNALIRQRQWQCLTLVLDGPTGTLYWNGIPVGRQTWDQPLRGTDVPLTIGSTSGVRDFLNAKLAAFTIYEGALDSGAVAGLFATERPHYIFPPADYPEDDLFRLATTADGVRDAAEIPGTIEPGPGARAGDDTLTLTGEQSYLIVRDHRGVGLFHGPFTFVTDFRPAAGTSGMIFRRHHGLCLQLLDDGTLRFDANIGRRNWVDFPAAITFGEWNRLRFSYDGRTATVTVNGIEIATKEYPGSLAAGSSFPIVFFADNTHPKFPNYANITGEIRELRLMPDVREDEPKENQQ